MANHVSPPRHNASFITLSTHLHRPVFEVARLAELFVAALLYCRTRGYLKLHAFLVLPDRVHLLLTPQSLSLESAVATLQKTFADRIPTHHALFEANYSEVSVGSLGELEAHRRALHNIPVQANLAPTPELYPWSSAHRTP